MGPADAEIRTTDSEKWTILKLSVFTVLICEGSAWTYHHGNENMTWDKAHKWCQINYTNMVFIRSKNENEYLNETMPGNKPYYWIGIKKKENGTWIWVETQKPIPEDLNIWATGEPSNNIHEVCVELYIKRPKDSGRWNNDRCDKKKRPLCYKDSCSDSTCSHHGECIEKIGTHNCDCWPGFHGNNCEYARSCMDLQRPKEGNMNCDDVYGTFKYKSICTFSCNNGFRLHGSESSECQSTSEWSSPIPTCLAVSCVDLQIPLNGKINCSDEYGKFQYKSLCNFSCEEGFELNGTKALLCQYSGKWSEPTAKPTCLAVSCVNLQIPANGKISCTDKYGKSQYTSSCNFSCDEGYELNGTKSVFCQHTGIWSEPTPTCQAVSCMNLQIPANGKINCTDKYGKSQYKSFCNFSCDEGYELNGTKSVFCQHTRKWSEPTPTCQAWNVSFGKQKQVTIVSSTIGALGLSLSSIPIVYILRKLRKKKEENAHIIQTNKDPPNTFENPAFEEKEMDTFNL